MVMKNHSRICLIFSATIVVVALIMTLCGVGVHWGIDFAEALNLRYSMNQPFAQADVEAALQAQGIGTYRVSQSGANGDILEIRVPGSFGEDQIQTLQAGLTGALLQTYPDMDSETVSVEVMGSAAESAVFWNAFWCVLLVAAVALCYVAFRFDFSSGIAAAFGIVHDMLITLSLMVLLRNLIQLNLSFIGAALAVLACSILNVTLILDRIRENRKKPEHKDFAREEIACLSVKDNLIRTLYTGIAAVILTLLVCIVGGGSVREFALPIVIGILVSEYSANMLSGYVWAFFEKHRISRKNAKRSAKKA